jgi:malate synthase
VAHPALVPVVQEMFDQHMPGPNQFHRIPEPAPEADLLAAPTGTRTAAGLRHNLRVAVRYLESWLRGQGCVALYGLMEDAATAEIARMQLWQWIHHEAEVEGVGRLDPALFHGHVQDALDQVQAEVGNAAFAGGRFLEAADLLETLILMPDPPAFLTLSAYERLADAVQPEVN